MGSTLSGDQQHLIGLANRMRLFAPPNLVKEAEAVIRGIVEISLKPSLDLRKLAIDEISEEPRVPICSYHSAWPHEQIWMRSIGPSSEEALCYMRSSGTNLFRCAMNLNQDRGCAETAQELVRWILTEGRTEAVGEDPAHDTGSPARFIHGLCRDLSRQACRCGAQRSMPRRSTHRFAASAGAGGVRVASPRRYEWPGHRADQGISTESDARHDRARSHIATTA